MKTAIAARRKDLQASLTDIRKELRKAEKAKHRNDVNKLNAVIAGMEKRMGFYSVSVKPVQFSNGFVLNGTLLEQFMRKLPKGSHLVASFAGEDALEIKYKNGKLYLYDLRQYFSGIKLPKGEVFLDDLGIDIN